MMMIEIVTAFRLFLDVFCSIVKLTMFSCKEEYHVALRDGRKEEYK